jgi:hypothetical protein
MITERKPSRPSDPGWADWRRWSDERSQEAQAMSDSRSSRQDAGASRSAAKPSAPDRAPRHHLLAAFLLAALLGCTAPEPNPTPTNATPTPFDSVAASDPFFAYRHALALGEQQRFTESLPWFRRALSEPTNAWQPHCDFAISLFHAALQSRVLRGHGRPVVRSSFERAALIAESSRELDAAERLAMTPEGKAYVIARRARQLAAFHLTWDAITEYRRAAQASRAPGVIRSVSRDAEREAARLLASMRDPGHGAAVEEP